MLFPEAPFGVEPFEVRSSDEVPAGDLLFGRGLFGDPVFSALVLCFSTLSLLTDVLAVVCWSETKSEFLRWGAIKINLGYQKKPYQAVQFGRGLEEIGEVGRGGGGVSMSF